MHDFTHSVPGRSLALALAIGIATLGCQPRPNLEPSSGAPEYQSAGMIAVPGGTVNAAGGNLMIERLDISIDTILGTQEIRAVYNAASGDWLWNFQVTYDGSAFLDPTGAVHDVGPVADGAAIPGTVYVKADADTIETKGGWAFHFGADGRLSHAGWKTADYPRIQYLWTGTLLEIEQCPGPASCLPFYSIALDPAGDPVSVTDARTGRVADFQYDGLGRLVAARDALAVDEGWPGFRYEYSLGGTLLTAITNSEGERIEYVYQGNRRIRDVIQIGEGNPTHRFGYVAKDADGLYKTLHTNPLGALTRYVVDGQRRLHRVELVDASEATTLTWLGRRPSSITLPSGVTTSFTYVDDDLASIVQPSGNVITYSYEFTALNVDIPTMRAFKRIEDSLGLIAEWTYEAQGRPTRIDTADGDTIEWSYEAATIATAKLPGTAQTTFPIYGVHGHWLDAITPSSEFPIRRSFDQVGNLLVSAAGLQDGGVLARAYDANRHVSQIEVAASDAGHVTSVDVVTIIRRSDGGPLSIQRPLGADHEFVYDGLGRATLLRENVDGQWHDTVFEYDAAGNLAARERPNGMREEFGYDGYGRLTRKAARRDGVLEGEALITYQGALPAAAFDSKRNVTEIYGYDGAGRVQTIVYSTGESMTFAYDLRGRVTQQAFVLPGGSTRTVGFEYDLTNRETRIFVDGSETIAEFSYQDGKRTSIRYGNGLVRNAAFDPTTLRLTGYTTTHPTRGVVEQTNVSRSVETNPQRFQISTSTATPLAATTENYLLGLAGVLTDIDKRVGNRVWAWDDGEGGSKTYVYDELSHLVSNTAGDSFTYNAERNRLLSATIAHEGVTVTYAYDEAGFVTSRNGAPMTWTATGRLASFGPVSIAWDVADRPISISVAGVTRDFSRFGGAVELDPGTGEIGSIDLGIASVSFASGSRLYRHTDFRGNVSFVSDEAGDIVAHYRYSAYGLDAVFGPSQDSRRFAGTFELGDGLVLAGARIYDAFAGRFLSQDPVFNELNQYAYTLGNPAQFWDPDGAHQTVAQAESQFTKAALNLVAAALIAAGGAYLYVSIPNPGSFLVALGGGVYLLLAIQDFADARANLQAAREAEAAAQGASSVSSSLPQLVGPETGNPVPPPNPTPADLGFGCAPTSLARLPDIGWALAFLLPLQLVLACLILRQRRRREPWR
jgi:RHS repeat-associated protein